MTLARVNTKLQSRDIFLLKVHEMSPSVIMLDSKGLIHKYNVI